jgi:hypothetical protein
MSGSQQERENSDVIPAPYPMFNITTKRAENSLFTQGWLGDKLCCVTVHGYYQARRRHRLA